MVQLYSAYHLNSAAHNARIAGDAEEALENEGRDGTFKNESLKRWQPIHDGHVTTSLMLSFASAEAMVNEIIDDPTSFNIQNRKLADFSSSYPSDILREGTITKYQLVLLYADVEPFDTGGQLYENLQILRQIRNYLTHYKPESWNGVGGSRATNLTNSLKNKDIKSNPFRSDDFGFGKYISYDCAKWAFKAVMDFSDATFDRLDGEPQYSGYRDRMLEELEQGWEEEPPNW